jgi:structural maintenance of chromosome 1
MREQRLGTATFIPLDSVRPTPINEKLRSMDNVRLLYDLLEYDKSLKTAVSYICGNTLVCETLQVANRIAFESSTSQRHKLVTLDGTVIAKSGFMTGGTSNMDKRVNQWQRKNIAGA